MIHNYIDNYKYSTVSSMEEYLIDQIVDDHKSDFVLLNEAVSQKDMEIDIEKFKNSNQILFIRSLNMLADIFNTNKNVATPATFVFKNLDSVIIFNKIPNNFPFISIRMKESNKIQCKDTDLIYDFPVDKIFKKELIAKKKFDIILESIGYLRYKLIGYDCNKIVIDDELKTSDGYGNGVINDNIGLKSTTLSFNNYLMSMFVSMIKQETQKDKILSFESDNYTSKTYLIIDDNNMIIEVRKQQEINRRYIAATQNPIMKSDKITDNKFIFDTFKQTFRIPYQKLVNVKSKLYYCLVHNADEYYFLKIISTGNQIKEAETLGRVFDSNDIIIEGYRIKAVEEII